MPSTCPISMSRVGSQAGSFASRLHCGWWLVQVVIQSVTKLTQAFEDVLANSHPFPRMRKDTSMHQTLLLVTCKEVKFDNEN